MTGNLIDSALKLPLRLVLALFGRQVFYTAPNAAEFNRGLHTRRARRGPFRLGDSRRPCGGHQRRRVRRQACTKPAPVRPLAHRGRAYLFGRGMARRAGRGRPGVLQTVVERRPAMSPLDAFVARWNAVPMPIPLFEVVNIRVDLDDKPDAWAGALDQGDTQGDVTMGTNPWNETARPNFRRANRQVGHGRRPVGRRCRRHAPTLPRLSVGRRRGAVSNRHRTRGRRAGRRRHVVASDHARSLRRARPPPRTAGAVMPEAESASSALASASQTWRRSTKNCGTKSFELAHWRPVVCS